MKIHVLSDLHIEFGDFTMPETDADVLVLAGDISVGMDAFEWIAKQGIEIPVVYVLGNHEYYRHEIGLAQELKRQAGNNIHVLDKDMIVIDGVRFLGCTLWTDFLIFGQADKPFSMRHANGGMADFHVITMKGRCFSPDDSIALHEAERKWLESQLSFAFDGATVVVTHHFPSAKSIHPRFASDMLTPAFGSDLEYMMNADKVALWVHGHTHDAFDYEVQGTRVVCNPRGYVGHERVDGFDAGLVVEV